MWVLGIKPRSSTRAAKALKHQAISPATNRLIKARESLPRRLEHDFCFSRAWTDFYKVDSVYINIISPGKHRMVPSKPGHSKSFDPTKLFLGKCLRKMP